jgi:hypothetical protein
MVHYNVNDLVKARSKLPLEVEVPDLGTVRFIPLSIAEIEEANIKGVSDAQGTYMLWQMLAKAEPGLTIEDVRSWPSHITYAIADAIFKRLDFRAKPSI